MKRFIVGSKAFVCFVVCRHKLREFLLMRSWHQVAMEVWGMGKGEGLGRFARTPKIFNVTMFTRLCFVTNP